MFFSQGADESQLRRVEVVLLDGGRLNIVCHVDCIGRQLYDLVARHLMLPEPTYFGLAFLHGNLIRSSASFRHVFLNGILVFDAIEPKLDELLVLRVLKVQ